MLARGRPVGEESAPWRWLLAAATLFLLALLGGSGFWIWRSSYETRGLSEFAVATARARDASSPEASPEVRQAAITALENVIDRYPRLSALPQAAFQLANLRLEAKAFGRAREAYQLALDNARTSTMRALSQLGLGYAWEADRNYA
ncbi:MAG: tol-pal system YbgF family protein, partial [Candidatus Methylomirabilia bacterium]